MTKLQKRAPKALKSLDAGLKSAPVPAGKRGASSLRGASTANSRPADPRRRLSHTRKSERNARRGGKFSCLQGLEKSRDCKRISLRRPHPPFPAASAYTAL